MTGLLPLYHFFWITLTMVSFASGSGTIRLSIWEDGCCSDSFDPSTCTCSSSAKLCLQRVVASSKSPDPTTGCFYERALQDFVGTGDFVVPFSFGWPGTIQITFAVGARLRVTMPVAAKPNGKLQYGFKEANSSTISYKLTVACDQGYHGEQCNAFCQPKDDDRGHYTCDDQGRLRCMKGWSGEKCLTPLCNNTLCVNCVPNMCTCRPGWRGARCDECIPYQGCANGYCHVPGQCLCHEYWGGLLCDRDLDPCRHHAPCKNGGSCSAYGLQNAYTCSCPQGFAGKNCEIKMGACELKPCTRFGQCRATGPELDDFECVCDDTHTGKRCEYDVNGVTIRAKQTDVEAGGCFFNGAQQTHGSQWTTMDCQHCSCQMGIVNCTSKACESRNCLQQPRSGSALSELIKSGRYVPAVQCPSDQVCHSVTSSVCLTEPCLLPYGQCTPWQQLDTVEAQDTCTEHWEASESDSSRCSRFYLTVDKDRLPKGTTVGRVCYHILLTLLTKKLDNYHAECHLVTESPLIVRVDLMSLHHLSPLGGLTDVLINDFRYNLTASPVLRAVTKVGHNGSKGGMNSVVVWGNRHKPVYYGDDNDPTVHPTGDSAQHILLLALSLTALLLMFAILALLIFKMRNRLFHGNRLSAQKRMPMPTIDSRDVQQVKQGSKFTVRVEIDNCEYQPTAYCSRLNNSCGTSAGRSFAATASPSAAKRHDVDPYSSKCARNSNVAESGADFLKFSKKSNLDVRNLFDGEERDCSTANDYKLEHLQNAKNERLARAMEVTEIIEASV